MARRYVSNKNETVRMFKSDFMEFFSHVHPATPLILYIPLVSYLLYLSFTDSELSASTVIVMFLVGIVYWTLIEYLLHRFVFHYEPRTAWGKRLHFIMHGVHHDYPNDATRLVMPPSLSIPLAIIFYYITLLIFGGMLAIPTFAGMVFGYVCYDTIHYATHHLPMKRGVLLWLKQHHLRHHYRDDGTGYGVSTPLWDYVFGTRSR